jgi:hypothetical protein
MKQVEVLMILSIDDDYRITADAHCWRIEKCTTRKRKGVAVTEFRAIRWYSTLSGAVDGLAELMLRTSDARTLDEAMTEVRRISATLRRALEPKFEVVEPRLEGDCGMAHASGAAHGDSSRGHV